MYHAARTTTCRLCEYQCYVAGNNALHSIAVDSAWWINAACQATIVNNSRSGAQGISTNVALPAGGCCYETMLLPRTSKQGKEKTLRIVDIFAAKTIHLDHVPVKLIRKQLLFAWQLFPNISLAKNTYILCFVNIFDTRFVFDYYYQVIFIFLVRLCIIQLRR